MSDVAKLCHLIRLHLDGKPLPRVEGLPAVEWLEYLRSDRTPFINTGLASRLDMQSNSPWVSEVAATLRGRLLSAL